MKTTELSPRRALVLAVSILVLASLACSPIVQPASAPGTVAKAGHWEGEPSVSFDVTDEGQIVGFKMVAPFGVLAGQYCTIEIDEIVVGDQGEFAIGDPSESPTYISGKFTGAKKLTGTFLIAICTHGDEATIVLSPEEKTWSAEWTGVQAISVSNKPTSAKESPPATSTPQPPTDTPTPVPPPPTHTPAPTATAPEEPTPTSTSPPLPAASWQPILDLPRQINSLAVDPTNPQILYAGTGDNGSGSGVYKSEDAGLTWQLAASGLPSEDVDAVALSADGSILYAAAGVRGDIYASTDGAQSWAHFGNTGLFGGFYTTFYTVPNDTNILFLISQPEDIIRSTDGGRVWLPANEGLPSDEHSVLIMSLAIDPTDASIIYAGTGGWVGGGHGVYKSTNGGETWSAANRGMLDYRITALAVDPVRSQTVYAGSDSGDLFKSTDGGQSWDDLTEAIRIHEYFNARTIRDIVVDPAAPETVYLLGDAAGILVSYNGGAKWRMFGKPGQHDQPSFTAMTIIFEPQLTLVVGIEREGAWRYAAD